MGLSGTRGYLFQDGTFNRDMNVSFLPGGVIGGLASLPHFFRRGCFGEEPDIIFERLLEDLQRGGRPGPLSGIARHDLMEESSSSSDDERYDVSVQSLESSSLNSSDRLLPILMVSKRSFACEVSTHSFEFNPARLVVVLCFKNVCRAEAPRGAIQGEELDVSSFSTTDNPTRSQSLLDSPTFNLLSSIVSLVRAHWKVPDVLSTAEHSFGDTIVVVFRILAKILYC